MCGIVVLDTEPKLVTLLPTPPSQSSNTISLGLPLDLALCKSVASLVVQCTDLENHISAIDARINRIVATYAATDPYPTSLLEAQQ